MATVGVKGLIINASLQ